jgi:hypothetical protein
VGRVTRAHDDVDIAVWHRDRTRIGAVLGESEWHHAPQQGEDGGTGYERAGVRLELTYLERERDDVFTPFSFGRGVWPAGAFGADERELQGIRVRVVSLRALLHGKAETRGDAADQAKDRDDRDVLTQLAAP